jgi:hypothetical protein
MDLNSIVGFNVCSLHHRQTLIQASSLLHEDIPRALKTGAYDRVATPFDAATIKKRLESFWLFLKPAVISIQAF